MKYIMKIIEFFLNIIYFLLKLLPTTNKVVMISRQSNKINDDFRLLGKELEKKYKVIYLCKTLDGKEKASFITRVGYGLHMFKQMYYLATSRVCVLDTYCPTVSLLKHKKTLTIIQMWHSNGTMKKFGYSAIGKREGSSKKMAKLMKMHRNYDYVLSSGEAYNDHLAKGFKIDKSIIRIYTLPRFDLLTDKDYEKEVKNKIYQKYPQLKSKLNVVYAPTFRKDEEKFAIQLNNLIEQFDTEKYNLIIKLHPLSKVDINTDKVIVDHDFSTFDMLFVTDKLISDYSCIIYEAGVRNIPLYFYAYDLSYYDFIRGLALDYSELPGYTENKAEELVKDLDKDYDMDYLKEFIKKYVENTENCTKKLADFISEFMK